MLRGAILGRGRNGLVATEALADTIGNSGVRMALQNFPQLTSHYVCTASKEGSVTLGEGLPWALHNSHSWRGCPYVFTFLAAGKMGVPLLKKDLFFDSTLIDDCSCNIICTV